MSKKEHSYMDDSEHLANIFEERAEFLSKEELKSWTARTTRDDLVISKLKGPGAKLLSGPRGSGKSTLLRRAYFELIEEGGVLAVYVNYSRSLALEPLIYIQANAFYLFRQWVVMKIIVGLEQSFKEMAVEATHEFKTTAAYANRFIHDLEVGDIPEWLEYPIAPSELLSLLHSWTKSANCRRCVLFLDDAAHAFSLDQQRDFFEILRELRSRKVSAKAAVYSGITSYSPNFHVGHEAELLEAWYQPNDPKYLIMMREIVKRRLPFSRLSQELIDLMAFASFGLPRGFLNMVSQVLSVEDQKPTRRDTLKAISEHAESIRHIFQALALKLPRFKHFIEVGRELERAATDRIQTYNKNKSLREKAVIIAIQDPIPSELERILQFLEYAGLLRKGQSVSKGSDGIYQRYTVHYALLISTNSLNLGATYSLSDLILALSHRDAHAFARAKATTLLGNDYQTRCTLDMPPCPKCSEPRLVERQYFCLNCGTELTRASLYKELLNTPLENLPLTTNKIDGIKTYTNLRTVQDILSDDSQSIMNVPYIGKVWNKRIKNMAEEFVSV
jgi:ABC-type hemin transport system ATPase subunit